MASYSCKCRHGWRTQTAWAHFFYPLPSQSHLIDHITQKFRTINHFINLTLNCKKYLSSQIYPETPEHSRLKRQAEQTEAPEGSGEPEELLVEQPKKGASLGEILGKN